MSGRLIAKIGAGTLHESALYASAGGLMSVRPWMGVELRPIRRGSVVKGLRPIRWGSAIVIGLLAGGCEPTDTPAQNASPPSTFEIRGVVEGFYGPPWSHEDRLDILRFMGRVGLTAYIYAPKNDPYHRQRWREPYPPVQRARLRALIDSATAHDVEFWYAISPGLSMVYSNPRDYDDLVEKIDSISALGVRRFGLFLDDVPTRITHAADSAVYPDLASAHADLINRLQRDLQARESDLMVTPTIYTDAWGDRGYVGRLGESVDPAVGFLWTGIDVVSPEVTAEHASTWSSLARRPPIIWDNFPVNDFARWRVFLGPIRGRSADLADAARGIVSNPMNEAHASMIPLYTVARYLDDPRGYDPDTAHRDALEWLYGPIVADALEPLTAVFGGDAFDENVFAPLFFLRDTIDLAPIERTVDTLTERLSRLEPMTSTGTEPLEPLLEDLRPMVSSLGRRVTALGADDRYRRLGDTLVYRRELDRIRVESRGPVVVDGRLDEWTGPPHPLTNARGSRSAGVRVAADATNLYLAVEVNAPDVVPASDTRIGEGDHIALIFDHDPADGVIQPSDLTLLFAPPGSERAAADGRWSLRFDGFMAQYLADNRNLTFTEFHLTTFGGPPAAPVAALARAVSYAARRTGSGYVAEIALPHEQRPVIRMSLTVTSTVPDRRIFALAHRNFPAAPGTYAELVLPTSDRQ